MLLTDSTITLICSWYDSGADVDKSSSYVLDGVSVYLDNAVTTSSGGATASNLTKIRIPYREGYLPEDAWKGQSDSWTLRTGDRIVVNGKTMTIQRWRDNTLGRLSPHWYVEAK